MAHLFHRSSSHSSSHPISLNIGPFAGILVACLVTGAALASGALLLWQHYCCAKSVPSDSTVEYEETFDFGTTLERILQRLPRSDSGEARAGLSLVVNGAGQLHDSFDKNLQPSPSALDRDRLLNLLDPNTRTEDNNWPVLLCDPDIDRRLEHIQYYILKVVCARIDMLGDPETTLLPVPVVQGYRSVNESAETYRKSDWLKYWRALSGHLMQETYPGNEPTHRFLSKTDLRYPAIRKLAEELTIALAPVAVQDQQQQEYLKDDLTKIISNAALLGWYIFGQRKLHQIEWLEGELTPRLASWFEYTTGNVKHIYGVDDSRALPNEGFISEPDQVLHSEY